VATPPTERIRVLLADDESPSRQRLRDLLHKDQQVTAIVEAENGLVAVEKIRQHKPDLVFLDVQMPELDGLGVIEAVGAEQMPLTIFVTAYDQHAIRAFDANALDYLLKPFSDERFEAAMARAKSRLDERNLRDFGRRMLQMVSKIPPQSRRWDRLVVKSAGSTRFLRVVEIDWIEAAGVYVTLHIAGKEFLYRASLAELAEKLDPSLGHRQYREHRPAGTCHPR
jgi:two-component system LytT family response regulator